MRKIPLNGALVMLIGPSGAGKSTLIEKHFDKSEVVSSDSIRSEATGDFQRQDCNAEVFEEFYRRIEWRMSMGLRVVTDATHLELRGRRIEVEMARKYGYQIFYVVVNRDIKTKIAHGGWRNDVRVKGGKTLIEAHEISFQGVEKNVLRGDGEKDITVIDTRTTDLEVCRPLDRYNPAGSIAEINKRGFTHIVTIGDVHGNLFELEALLQARSREGNPLYIFLGDVIDYGSQTWEVVDLVYDMVNNGQALMIRGNHEKKMVRYFQTVLAGKDYHGRLTHGNEITANQIKAMLPVEAERCIRKFLRLVALSPDWWEIGNWLFVHAAASESMFGKPMFRAVPNSWEETMAVYGQVGDGQTDDGYPERLYDWVQKVPPGKNVAVGHQIMSTTEIVTMDTGGGKVVFVDTGSSKTGVLSSIKLDFSSDGRRLLWN